MRALRIAPAAAAAAWLAALAPSQVVISEINVSTANPPGTQWIEIANLGSTLAEVGDWAIYQATLTPGLPGNYWWAFPAGTTIAPGGFLRVHWLAPLQPSTSTEVYTGNTIFHFLFGYGAEPLSPASGALALLNTQANEAMNTPSSFVDWVSWGASGFQREDLAEQAGKWTRGQFVSAPIANDSIALLYSLQGEPTPPTSFFHDATPTGAAHNHPGAAATPFGEACSTPGVTAPALTIRSAPTQGNRDFQLVVQNTASNELVFLLLGVGRGSGAFKIPGSTCAVWVDVSLPTQIVGLPGSAGETAIPVSLLGQITGEVILQALKIAAPNRFGTSNGLELDIGG